LLTSKLEVKGFTMQHNQTRLIVTLHPKGGLLLHSADLDENVKSFESGKATSVELLLADFVELELKDEAERLRTHEWPESVPVEMVFIIPETEETMKRLGFREVGAIL
jgi:hypothetical protein